MSQIVDWAGWLKRWDDQQAGYLPDREEQFALMLDIVARLAGEPARFVDLACGPGSISLRAGQRFPAATSPSPTPSSPSARQASPRYQS